MPWKDKTMSQQRLAFVQLVESVGYPVAHACREFGVSRKTGYKWLERHRSDPEGPLTDQSRRPCRSPHRTHRRIERQILAVHDEYGWGARKVRAVLSRCGVSVPSIRTVHNVLKRHERVNRPSSEEPQPPAQRFERSKPNELWQLDFKGPIEVDRHRRRPLTVVDDHSRYLLLLRLCDDVTFHSTWQRLWDTFGEYGLPDELLSDNAFAGKEKRPRTLSRFDRDLVRLAINPIHGRPYHPQTQGKVERLHGTFQRELFPRVRRDCLDHFHQDAERWRDVYNHIRPHEALGDLPPISRWRPSPRRRPAALPPVEYPAGSLLRKVASGGDIQFHSYRILVGAGLVGEHVRIEERDDAITIYYSWKLIRLIAKDQLARERLL